MEFVTRLYLGPPIVLVNQLTPAPADLALPRRNRKNDPLWGLLCPNDVRTGADHDPLFQGSVEWVGNFGHAEILDDPKAFVAQHFRQLGWIEKTEPWLAARRRPRGNCHHIGTAIV